MEITVGTVEIKRHDVTSDSYRVCFQVGPTDQDTGILHLVLPFDVSASTCAEAESKADELLKNFATGLYYAVA